MEGHMRIGPGKSMGGSYSQSAQVIQARSQRRDVRSAR
jgi:hypothetical protein